MSFYRSAQSKVSIPLSSITNEAQDYFHLNLKGGGDMSFLDGYKTYIMAGLGALTVLGLYFKVIDSATAQLLLGIFGFGGLAALRSAQS